MATKTAASKSDLFSAYNCASALARQGRMDPVRLRRALGVAQRTKPRPVAYITTWDGCSCPDWQNRGRHTGKSCKHMLAKLLVEVGRGLSS